jgi:uncharacterized protein YbaP (TraB family)
MSRLYILVLILLCAVELTAQPSPRTARTLLWKIDGNGLSQPSYLYGTMHVRDKRAFDFGDSVLVAFGRCRAFAAELQLDSAMAWFLRQMVSPDTTEESVVSEEIEVSGVPVGERKVPRWMERMMESSSDDYDKGGKDGRETFLDAWLFRIAKLEQKEVLGIETMREQIDALYGSSLEDEVMEAASSRGSLEGRRLFESMVRTYRQGDLDALLRVMEQSGLGDDYMDRLLTRRNHVMAERIDTMIRRIPTFVAVGAGHLPGDEGVIQLLRQRGFSVEPVKVTRTGMARKYHEPDRELPWAAFTDTALGYSARFPIEPVDLKKYTFNPSEGMGEFTPASRMLMSIDITTMTVYIAAALERSPGYPITDPEGMIQEMVDRFAKTRTGDVDSRKYVTMEGAQGYEITGSKQGMRVRGLILRRGSNVYLLIALAATPHSTSNDMERFIKSFALAPQPDNSWQRVTEPTGAFTVTMPGTIHRQIDNTIRPYYSPKLQTGAIAADDPATGTSYVVAWIEQSSYGAGFPDSTLSSWALAQLNQRLGTQGDQQKFIEYKSVPGSEAMLEHPKGTAFRTRFFMRGNRLYWLLAGGRGNAATSNDAEQFFNSLTFIDPAPATWTRQTLDSLGFTISLPSSPAVYGSRDPYVLYSRFGMATSEAIDSNTSNRYSVRIKSFSDYARESTSDSVLLGMMLGGDEDDTTLISRSLTVNGRPAKEFELTVPGSGRMRRSRTILNGTTVYRIDAIVPAPQGDDPFVDTFFDSFTITESPRGDLFTDKLQVLLNDLSSSDSTRHIHAKEALNWFRPQKNELPLLHETLRRLYHDAPDILDTTRGELLGLLTGGDSTSVELIRSLLPDIPGDELGGGVEALIRINSRESLDLLADLLATHSNEITLDGNYAFYSLIYQPGNTGVMFPRILPLLDDTDKVDQLLQLTASALDSNVISPSVVEPYSDTIVRIMREQLSPGDSEGDEESDENAENYRRNYLLQAGARTLGWLTPTDSIRSLLRELLSETEADIQREAAVALMRQKEELPEQLLTTLMEAPLQRLEMYRSLDRTGIISRFPATFRTQEKIAEGLAAESIYSDEESSVPEYIELVSTQQRGDGRYFVFRFRFSSEEDDPWYAAVVGPQPLEPSQINAVYVSSVTSYEKMDAMSVDEHIQAAITRRAAMRETE